MKRNIIALFAVLFVTPLFTSCVYDVYEGGGYPPQGYYPPQRNHSVRLPIYGDAQYVEPPNGGFRYENRNPYQPRDAGRNIYHGSQARHVYGSGPQSYARIPDPRDPNPYRPR